MTKLQRRRREQRMRKKKIHVYVERVRSYRKLEAQAVERNDSKTATFLAGKIRTLRQQITYMGGNSHDI